MKQDRQWATRLGKVVCDAATLMNGMRNELDACIVVLSAFEEPLIRLQSENEPTINQVWKDVLKLRKEMLDGTNNESNTALVRAVSRSALLAIDRKLNDGLITDGHKIATFLNPKTRHLRHLSDAEKREVHTLVRTEMEAIGPPVTQPEGQAHIEEEADVLEEVADERPAADELDCYLNAYYAETASSVFDLLEFWCSRETQFPGLAAVAMKDLAIPATSASCERAFRRLKLLVPDSRESLKPGTITKLMLAKHYKLQNPCCRVLNDVYVDVKRLHS